MNSKIVPPPGTTPLAPVVDAPSGAITKQFSLGGFGPTLAEQGLEAYLTPEAIKHFDQDDAAISRLHMRGLITYSAHVRAREKLAAEIRRACAVRPTNPETQGA